MARRPFFWPIYGSRAQIGRLLRSGQTLATAQRLTVWFSSSTKRRMSRDFINGPTLGTRWRLNDWLTSLPNAGICQRCEIGRTQVTTQRLYA